MYRPDWDAAQKTCTFNFIRKWFYNAVNQDRKWKVLLEFCNSEQSCSHLLPANLLHLIFYCLGRGRWRSKVVFSSQNPAHWTLLSQWPVSRMKRKTDRWIRVAGLPLTTKARTHTQQARKMTKKYVYDSPTYAHLLSLCCVWVCTYMCVEWLHPVCPPHPHWLIQDVISWSAERQSCNESGVFCSFKWCQAFCVRIIKCWKDLFAHCCCYKKSETVALVPQRFQRK